MKGGVTQITTLYSRGEQKSISDIRELSTHVNQEEDSEAATDMGSIKLEKKHRAVPSVVSDERQCVEYYLIVAFLFLILFFLFFFLPRCLFLPSLAPHNAPSNNTNTSGVNDGAVVSGMGSGQYLHTHVSKHTPSRAVSTKETQLPVKESRRVRQERTGRPGVLEKAGSRSDMKWCRENIKRHLRAQGRKTNVYVSRHIEVCVCVRAHVKPPLAQHC